MSMKVEEVLRMAGGNGQFSYSSNSKFQENALKMTTPILGRAVREASRSLPAPERRLVLADLGCSCGPNTFVFVSEVLRATHLARSTAAPPPRPLPIPLQETTAALPLEIQIFLNDLPGNDFNHLFRCLEEYKKTETAAAAPFYVAGLPGSFYRRLMPCSSVHFFHSSASLQWLSQVPPGLEVCGAGYTLNKRSIYPAKKSPHEVARAYQEQHRRDFSTFLQHRFEELYSGGRMVLSMAGRGHGCPPYREFGYLWMFLAESLSDLVDEGMIPEEKLLNFNMPCYAPSMDELEATVESGGLFEIEEAQTIQVDWHPFDESSSGDDAELGELESLQSGIYVAKFVRAASQPLLAHHFGEQVLDEVFAKYAAKASKHLLREKTNQRFLVISLKKKG